MKNTSFGPFNIWAKKKFGVVSIVRPNWRAMVARLLSGNRPEIANAAEGWHPDGRITVWPIDYTQYTTRYLAVTYAASGAQSALVAAGFAYAASIPDGSFVNRYPFSPLGQAQAIPLGIACDEITSSIDVVPYSFGVQLLGGGQRRTQVGITDGVVAFNTLLVGSASQPGQLTAIPSTPGAYWSFGLSLSTSEGAGAQIEFDPRPCIVGVDVIT